MGGLFLAQEWKRHIQPVAVFVGARTWEAR